MLCLVLPALLAGAIVGAARAQEEAGQAEPPRQAAPDQQLQPGEPGQPAEPARPGEGRRRPPAPTDPADRQISLRVELRPWYTAPGGRFTLPGEARGGRDIDVEQLNLDSPRLSPAGRVRLDVDEWSFSLSGAHFRTERDAISPVNRRIGDIDLMAGDEVQTEYAYTTAELLVGNTFFQRRLRAFDHEETRFGLELEAGLGARLDHFDIQLERAAGGAASADEFFLAPLAAFEARFHPAPRATVSFAATAGWNPGLGDHTAITSDLIVRAAWQFTPRIQAMAGYRITIQRMEAGEGPQRFEFNGSHAGLFAGIRIGF